MRAIVQDAYGPPESLRLTHLPDPTPGPGQALVRVAAASVNAADWHVLRGDPYLARPGIGWRRPRHRVAGMDLSGTVEAVGPGVTRVAVGDAVYADVSGTGGAFAELAVVDEDLLAPAPSGVPLEHAAAIPLAGGTALAALTDAATVHPGASVLVLGGSGGVGTFAVQIATALGAEVTAVCSRRNVDLVEGIGAHHVIAYDEQDPTEGASTYDVVLDLVGVRPLQQLRRAAGRRGTVVLCGGGTWSGPSIAGPMGLMLRGTLGSPLVPQTVRVLVTKPSREALVTLGDLVEGGRVRPVVDRTWALAEVPAAVAHVESGHARGKQLVLL